VAESTQSDIDSFCLKYSKQQQTKTKEDLSLLPGQSTEGDHPAKFDPRLISWSIISGVKEF